MLFVSVAPINEHWMVMESMWLQRGQSHAFNSTQYWSVQQKKKRLKFVTIWRRRRIYHIHSIRVVDRMIKKSSRKKYQGHIFIVCSASAVRHEQDPSRQINSPLSVPSALIVLSRRQINRGDQVRTSSPKTTANDQLPPFLAAADVVSLYSTRSPYYYYSATLLLLSHGVKCTSRRKKRLLISCFVHFIMCPNTVRG